MKRNPRDLVRYNASERANHWVVGICFILLALSGLAFFHPAFFPLTQLFGGGPWTRILHPYIGVVMALSQPSTMKGRLNSARIRSASPSKSSIWLAVSVNKQAAPVGRSALGVRV